MKQKYIHKRIPIGDVIVLPQVRKTFDIPELWELAEDIAINGILQPSIICALTKSELIEHLKLESKINNVKLSIEQMRPSSDGLYYRLIAGERRYRAHKLLLETGCEKCREKGKTGEECYASHFKNTERLMEVRSCLNISAKEAKSIQFRENNHRRPPLDEEAYSYQETFVVFKEEDPKYTMKEFALYAGVGIGKVRQALTFVNLPFMIREAVRNGIFSFSHALEFKRLLNALKGDETHPLFQNAFHSLYTVSSNIRSEKFREQIGRYLESINQIGMFGEDLEVSIKARRGTFAREFLPGVMHFRNYVARVLHAQKHGLLGKGKPLSGGSPSRQIPALLWMFEKLVPGLKFTKAQRLAINRLNLEKVGTRKKKAKKPK